MALLLHPPVVADAQDGAVVGDQRAADRHAALVAADPGLLDGDGQELVAVADASVVGPPWSGRLRRYGLR